MVASRLALHLCTYTQARVGQHLDLHTLKTAFQIRRELNPILGGGGGSSHLFYN
jgi:hypothetical protein